MGQEVERWAIVILWRIWDFVHNFVHGGDSLEALDQSCSLEPVRIMWGKCRVERNYTWRDQLGCCHRAEGNECLD